MNGYDIPKDYSRPTKGSTKWSQYNDPVHSAMEPYAGAVGSKMNQIDHNGPKAIKYKGPRARDYVGEGS
jgi:hypothetical protein